MTHIFYNKQQKYQILGYGQLAGVGLVGCSFFFFKICYPLNISLITHNNTSNSTFKILKPMQNTNQQNVIAYVPQYDKLGVFLSCCSFIAKFEWIFQSELFDVCFAFGLWPLFLFDFKPQLTPIYLLYHKKCVQHYEVRKTLRYVTIVVKCLILV